MRPRLCAALVCTAAIWPAAAADAATHTIGITGNVPSNFRYDPSTLRVPVGDTVTWPGSMTHPLVFDSPADGPYNAAQTRTLTTPGTISYHCQIHQGSGMTGTVTVDSPPTIAIERQTASPRAGQPVSFRANANDPEGKPVRIDWDLDGDGTFERVNADALASATYGAGQHTVNARVTDDLGASATSSHTFTVPGESGGGAPSGDKQAPELDARARKSIRVAKLRRRGVKLTLTASEDGRLVAVLRNRRGHRLGRKTADAHAGQATVMRLRAPHAKRGRLKLRIVAIDLAGNRTKLVRRLTATAAR